MKKTDNKSSISKKTIITIITIGVLVVTCIIGLAFYSNQLNKQEELKNQKDKEAIEQYRKDVLEQSNKEYKDQLQKCSDYIANGGSELDKNYQLSCKPQGLK